jgi:hypothetical protein
MLMVDVLSKLQLIVGLVEGLDVLLIVFGIGGPSCGCREWRLGKMEVRKIEVGKSEVNLERTRGMPAPIAGSPKAWSPE